MIAAYRHSSTISVEGRRDSLGSAAGGAEDTEERDMGHLWIATLRGTRSSSGRTRAEHTACSVPQNYERGSP
jgi:hypothetical protein